jgi:hypothetical protein
MCNDVDVVVEVTERVLSESNCEIDEASRDGMFPTDRPRPVDPSSWRDGQLSVYDVVVGDLAVHP